jgi:hypothetical protein
MAHSTMVPHTMIIPARNMVASQAPIGKPLSSKPISSLPLGYNTLNASIPIPTQVPFGAFGVFTSLGYNVASGSIPTPPSSSLEGLICLLWGYLAQVAPLPLAYLLHHSLLVIIFSLGGNVTLGGKLNLEVKPKLGHHPHLEENSHLEDITHNMDITSSDHYPSIGTFSSKEIHNHLGGNNLKLDLSYPLVWASHISVLPIPFRVQMFNLVSLSKGTSLISTTLWATCLHMHV